MSRNDIVIPIQVDTHNLSTPLSSVPSPDPSPLSTDAIIHHGDNAQVRFHQTFFEIIVIHVIISLQIVIVVLHICIQVNVSFCFSKKKKIFSKKKCFFLQELKAEGSWLWEQFSYLVYLTVFGIFGVIYGTQVL